ncbi:MAG: hypothetical protein JW963_00795 [Anaerolineales bacterium]|nr:hypothetical protein [Anaerolineales bacterium]
MAIENAKNEWGNSKFCEWPKSLTRVYALQSLICILEVSQLYTIFEIIFKEFPSKYHAGFFSNLLRNACQSLENGPAVQPNRAFALYTA